MLLNFIIEPDSDPGKPIYLVYSKKDDRLTKSKIKISNNFYRQAMNGCLFNNIIETDGGMELHRLMWIIQSSMLTRFVIFVRPGIFLGYKTQGIVMNIVNTIPQNRKWGVIKCKSNTNNFFILNPLFSSTYKSDNIDDIVRSCKANNLEVIETDEIDGEDDRSLDQSFDNSNWSDQATDFIKKVRDGTIDAGQSELVKVMPLPNNKKIELTSYQTKNIVYHKSYEKDLSQFVGKFEKHESFSTVPELREMINKYSSDTTWVIGNLLTIPTTFWLFSVNYLEGLIHELLEKENTIVWAKLYSNANEYHSTLNIDSVIYPD